MTDLGDLSVYPCQKSNSITLRRILRLWGCQKLLFGTHPFLHQADVVVESQGLGAHSRKEIELGSWGPEEEDEGPG